MKALLLLLVLGISEMMLAQKGTTVTISVENISNNKGKIILGMTTKETFMKVNQNFLKR